MPTPTLTAAPTPTAAPASNPTLAPTSQPLPTGTPTVAPSISPSAEPTPTPAAPSASPLPPGAPSSDARIDEALAKGEITKEQATIYEAFSAFHDPRLPEQFRGYDADRPETPAWWLDYPSLSPEGQALLRPFLLRPDVADSWYYVMGPGRPTAGVGRIGAATRPPGGWFNVTGSKIRVLYDISTLETQAQQILAETEAVIWPKLFGLLKQYPPDDCLLSCGDKGGSTHYDIYLVDTFTPKDSDKLAYTQPELGYLNRCNGVPSYIVMDASRNDFGVLAHEAMHAFQFGFPFAGGDSCREYRWFGEAVAEWAMDYVYGLRFNDHPHTMSYEYLTTTSQSLNKTNDKREYGEWLFFFYLSKIGGSPGLIRDIMIRAANQSDSLKAIDETIPDGFKKHFPEFSKQNWNPDWSPLNRYRVLDKLDEPGQQAQTVDLLPKVLHNTNVFEPLSKSKVDYLSSIYFDYKVDLGSNLTTIMFLNGYTYKLEEKDVGRGLHSYYATDLGANSDARKYGKVIALVKRVGRTDWDVEDWTNQASAFFCQDDPKQLQLEEVVLILTNSNPDRNSQPIQAQGMKPGFWQSNMGCYQWKGTANFENEDHTWTIKSNVTWQRIGVQTSSPAGGGGAGSKGSVGLGLAYSPIDGKVTWKASGVDKSGCRHFGEATWEFKPGVSYPATIMTTFNFVPSGPYVGAYWGAGLFFDLVKETVSCKGGSTTNKTPLPQWVVMCLNSCASGQFPIVDATGSKMSGVFPSLTTDHWDWNYTAISAP